MHDKENTKAYSNISYVVLSGILDAHGCGHQMLLVVDFGSKMRGNTQS
jgi:hypothetical protein